MNGKVLQCCGIRQYTDREVAANRPDIAIKNKRDTVYILKDVAIIADRNVVQKEKEHTNVYVQRYNECGT